MTHRHATDVISLIAAVIFGGWTIVWLLDVTNTVHRENAWLAGPVILIAAGLLGLLASLRRRTDVDDQAAPPADTAS